jgi:hypothetical protein
MQAALSRHADDSKSTAGCVSGILGLSEDLDAQTLVSSCPETAAPIAGLRCDTCARCLLLEVLASWAVSGLPVSC